ncbi:MAG TPA: TraR/DksA C4-type zinc finger protein [Candidatus Eisenbacteria bacterium]|nr:TraR/DksA C4-type zinc finger protein [Candidatus Eisenbacteria bacterium]
MNVAIGRERLDRIRRKLLDRQRRLFDDVDGLEADLRVIEEGREPELETRGQAEAMTRLLDCVRERDRRELAEIHRALAKIPIGGYGPCESCSRPIAVERLLATPETRYCLACASRLETTPALPPRPFEPSSHRPIPPDHRDLGDDELAETVRERIRAHGDPDLAGVSIRCHGGVVRLSGELPSEAQRQVLVQLVADGLGLEVRDRVRVTTLDREEVGDPRPEEEVRPLDEERIPGGRGMQPLAAERWTVPEDEGEPPETAPDSPIPERE